MRIFLLNFPLKRHEKPARDPAYLKWMRRWSCIVCKAKWGIQAHHTGPHGMGQKPSDYDAIPLCATHHMEYHREGREYFETHHQLDITQLVDMYRAIWTERTGKKAA